MDLEAAWQCPCGELRVRCKGRIFQGLPQWEKCRPKSKAERLVNSASGYHTHSWSPIDPLTILLRLADHEAFQAMRKELSR
jgi:hypothetical protein